MNFPVVDWDEPGINTFLWIRQINDQDHFGLLFPRISIQWCNATHNLTVVFNDEKMKCDRYFSGGYQLKPFPRQLKG